MNNWNNVDLVYWRTYVSYDLDLSKIHRGVDYLD